MHVALCFALGFTLHANAEVAAQNAIPVIGETQIQPIKDQVKGSTVEKPSNKKTVHGDLLSSVDFVKKFYEWYLPKLNATGATRTSELALKQRKSEFDPQLVKALLEDFSAQNKAAGEIVGIDFDPFLNAQDPAEHYEVGKSTQKGVSFYVDIFELTSDKKPKIADVRVQLVKQNGQWCFVNFHYPKTNSNLMAILKSLADNRKPNAEKNH